MQESILLRLEDQIATITLNRPEVFNAFNDQMSYALLDVLAQVDQDPSIRAVILTGSGKAFCSGQDLKNKEHQENKGFRDSLEKRYNPMIRYLRRIPKPIICQLNGVAAGAGCSLVLACDLVIASESAYLVEIFMNIGLVPDSGSSYFLPRTLGYHKAFEMLTKSSRISAREAQQLGLVNLVVPGEDLERVVKKEAVFYAQAPTKAIGLVKKMLGKGMNSSLDEVLDYEALCQEIAGGTLDHQEGIQAFLEKRKAQFRGE
ncbi:MAG: enoyl-CoA hydratase/isomerase family protein [Chitinophagaceae bacterium]